VKLPESVYFLYNPLIPNFLEKIVLKFYYEKGNSGKKKKRTKINIFIVSSIKHYSKTKISSSFFQISIK
jgi:hypothetical protein